MDMVAKRPPGTKVRNTRTSTALIRRATLQSDDADGIPGDLRHLLPRRLHRLPLLAPLLQPRRLHQHIPFDSGDYCYRLLLDDESGEEMLMMPTCLAATVMHAPTKQAHMQGWPHVSSLAANIIYRIAAV
ncbi:uncharacterized protein LOC119324406 isoform X2 [Triticum dicoccoides]|uniref:uncharacterized protein LOC119324406 isoform X2 n=1 Tax=Triticum dicoccoides TaxID=85692 RepID=UPI0018915AF3|nr:uncharacterized protein LOC119324406 isoform X2 [Triticum dicoccoides]